MMLMIETYLEAYTFVQAVQMSCILVRDLCLPFDVQIPDDEISTYRQFHASINQLRHKLHLIDFQFDCSLG